MWFPNWAKKVEQKTLCLLRVAQTLAKTLLHHALSPGVHARPYNPEFISHITRVGSTPPENTGMPKADQCQAAAIVMLTYLSHVCEYTGHRRPPSFPSKLVSPRRGVTVQ